MTCDEARLVPKERLMWVKAELVPWRSVACPFGCDTLGQSHTCQIITDQYNDTKAVLIPYR